MVKTKRASRAEAGNTVVIVLVALVVVAVGALAYLSGQMAGEENVQDVTTASAELGDAETQQAGAENADGTVIQPGNPIVAKVGTSEVTRGDVFAYIQNLPPNARQLPIEQLFPAAMEQVINNMVINDKTKAVKLDNDPEVKKQLATAKENIVRTVYIQNQITKRITDERMNEAYRLYVSQFPKAEEVRARHILVEDKKLAKSLIGELKDGGDFEALAKEHSTDGTAPNGGDLGYFLKTDVVAPFAEAAFSTEPGSYTMEPIESEFGFHIVKVEDKRMREPADFDTAKPFLETQLRRAVLDEVVNEWRDAAAIKRFDINGQDIEPASGEEAAPEAEK